VIPKCCLTCALWACHAQERAALKRDAIGTCEMGGPPETRDQGGSDTAGRESCADWRMAR